MLRSWLLVAAVSLLPTYSSAAGIISDGNVSLGVDDLGQLNVSGGTADVVGETVVGVRWVDPDTGIEYESTSHGCLCEGWGIAVDGPFVGEANNSTGTSGLTSISFGSTATTADSVVRLDGTGIFITHSFALAEETDDLYEVSVVIQNLGTTDYANVEYRRVMDWDTSPTPFTEFVTIGGTETTTLLASSSNDGFATSNPLDPVLNAGTISCGIDVDFSSCGPSDHGALFDFDLGPLAAGDSIEFTIFFGGAANETEANEALGAVGAELFSYGWSAADADQDGFADASGAVTPTFIFAFSGVGGTIVQPPPPPIPLPAAAWLMLGALGMLGGLRARKSKSA